MSISEAVSADIRRVDAVTNDIVEVSQSSAAQIAEHSSNMMQQVSVEVSRHLKRIRAQLDELDQIVMRDAGNVQQAIRDHMRIASHAVSTGDNIERELLELRAMLERPRT